MLIGGLRRLYIIMHPFRGVSWIWVCFFSRRKGSNSKVRLHRGTAGHESPIWICSELRLRILESQRAHWFFCRWGRFLLLLSCYPRPKRHQVQVFRVRSRYSESDPQGAHKAVVQYYSQWHKQGSWPSQLSCSIKISCATRESSYYLKDSLRDSNEGFRYAAPRTHN